MTGPRDATPITSAEATKNKTVSGARTAKIRISGIDAAGRLARRSDGQSRTPDSLGGWRDPFNVRRIWRRVRDDAARKISDQLGHSKVSMTQDHYLGRRLTDRQTADVLEKSLGSSGA